MQKKEEKKEEAYFSPGKCVVFKTMCNSHRFIVESYCRWDLGWDLLLSLLGIFTCLPDGKCFFFLFTKASKHDV